MEISHLPLDLRKVVDQTMAVEDDVDALKKEVKFLKATQLRDSNIKYSLLLPTELRVQYDGRVHFYESPWEVLDWFETLGQRDITGASRKRDSGKSVVGHSTRNSRTTTETAVGQDASAVTAVGQDVSAVTAVGQDASAVYEF
ncbi:hypothetical protein NDU88_003805 [Pleurodeles waltl]|uniref:Uncharacterized protein n=1 Tax=Pleurodeles waltl TaxID=8319 RepID=A0AAV7T651_PLEWA|nr:hypothetical protein NDU88_003805 [Pleurodeles waltl]